ncbi:Adenylate kinase [Hondaea fermentalgiana]|uniref:Adenylate kinase n=1 Tax=Hondaea fermentalgiana TaxID=2315210 RepID=A0A2R5GFH9_9STRA|nr:Adenylate kinase [Hondaea fermentalgiana]|eukprot:GBG28518.1 Adenylate kinase [Hondaea fermentalgiana]
MMNDSEDGAIEAAVDRELAEDLHRSPHEGVELAQEGSVGTILICGPPSGGKSTQCKRLVDKYGLIHVSAGDLLRARQNLMPELAAYIDAGRLVPDELVCAIIKERLAERDCREKGVLLDGFPRTHRQAEVLADLGVTVSHVILLKVEDEVVYGRVENRRIDPVSGQIFNMKMSPPEDPAVLARLVMRSDDTRDKMRQRLAMYHDNIDSIMQFYKGLVQPIEADAHPDRVFDRIRDIIEGDLYWGCHIQRSMTVRNYECSPTNDLGGSRDLITATQYSEHMLWLMLGRGVLADVRNPISFAGRPKIRANKNVRFLVRAHSVELCHALVPGLDVHCRVWLEHVGERSVVLGHTIATTQADVERALKLLMITGQQRRYLETLRESLQRKFGPHREMEIARGVTVLVTIDRQTGALTAVPQRRRLRNLVLKGALQAARSAPRSAMIEFAATRLQMEACPDEAFKIEYRVQPRDVGLDDYINPATLVSLVEMARFEAEVSAVYPRASKRVKPLTSSTLRPRCLWLETRSPPRLGDRVIMRTWILNKRPEAAKGVPALTGLVFVGFELKDMASKVLLRGCQVLSPASSVSAGDSHAKL